MKRLLIILFSFISIIICAQQRTLVISTRHDTINVDANHPTNRTLVVSDRIQYNGCPTITIDSITGSYEVGDTLIVHSTQTDKDGDLPGATQFNWYYANDSIGTNETFIIDTDTLVIGDSINGKFLRLEVIPKSLTGCKTGLVVESGSDSVTNWVYAMMNSYITINDSITYTQTEKDSIYARLYKSYIISTFGPLGLNKTVCDFFLFFENSNTSTALTTRTNTKTGETLRWDYGDGNVYTQNNLPGEINNGVITVTSVDGFSNWTTLDISNNTFIGYLPSLMYFTTLQVGLFYTNASLSGYFDINSNIVYVNINGTAIYGNLSVFNGNTNLNFLTLVNFSGDLSNLSSAKSLLNIYIVNNPGIYGYIDDLCNITTLSNLWAYGSGLNGYKNTKSIPAGWKNAKIYLYNNNFSTPSIDKFLMSCDTSFTGTSTGEIRMYTMGDYRSDVSSDAYSSLASKGVTFNASTQTFLNQKLNYAYVDDDEKHLVGITTYLDDYETIHPSAITMDSTLSGYKYWVGIAPFKDGDNNYENPSIFATNSKDTLIATTNNPIAPKELYTYNSDPEIIYVNDSLYCLWQPSGEAIKIKSSIDGSIWGSAVDLFAPIGNETTIGSPSIIYKTDTFFIYYCSRYNVETQTIKRRYSTNGIYGPYSGIDSIPTITEDTGEMWWHMDVNYINTSWYFILHGSYEYYGGYASKIYIAKSSNGLNFTRESLPILTSYRNVDHIANGSYTMYRPSFTSYGDHYLLYFTIIDAPYPTGRYRLANVEMWLIEP